LYLNPLEFALFLRRLKLTDGVVHANGYEGALLRYVVSTQVALVVTSHHPDPPQLRDIPRRLDWIGRARWVRRNVIPLLERNALRRADLVTSPSRFGAGSLRERGYLPQDSRVEVVPNGTPPLPHAQVCGTRAALVCVARLDHHKGIDILLRAFAAIPNPKPRLDLVGTGVEEGELKRIAAELNLSDRVCFRGHLERSSVAEILGCAITLVLPSRSENLPLVILEAMHAGLPIIATRVGGIPEAVRHEIEGLLVPPEDPASLAEAVNRMISDPELRLRLGTAARARAAAFTWERAAERYENLYESLRH
jgi:glycosyltransferase involved in cell wall biosynthesis